MAHTFRVQTDEAEVELLHARDVPEQGFDNDVLATGNIDRASQALLRADQNTVHRLLELVEQALPRLEAHVSAYDEQWSLREMLLEKFLVHGHRIERGAADGDLAAQFIAQLVSDQPGLSG